MATNTTAKKTAAEPAKDADKPAVEQQLDEQVAATKEAIKDASSEHDAEAEAKKEQEDRLDGLKQRQADAKDTEGDADTTADPDTARDTFGDIITVESGGAIAQPMTTAPVTYTDNRGVERIAGGFDDGWGPAPVDPGPALVRQNEAAMDRIRQGRENTARRQGELGAGQERPLSADEKADRENAKAARKGKS